MSVLKGLRVGHSHAGIGDDENDAVVRTLRTGGLTRGPMVGKFGAEVETLVHMVRARLS
jgi:dTDP-4-amino-4,6-dideoxygalactose transaminase